MMKFLYVVVILVSVFIGLTFTYMNNQLVELNYLSFHKEVNLSLLLLCTLVVGAFSGYFVSLFSSLKVRRELSKAKKELTKIELKGLESSGL